MATLVEPQTIVGELLVRLRAQPGCADATYEETPAEIVGGYDTSIFSFRLAGVAAPWDGPLILRLFRPRMWIGRGWRPPSRTPSWTWVIHAPAPCSMAATDASAGNRT
jgi:hypothetical protein